MQKFFLRVKNNPLTWSVLVVTFFTFFSRFLGFVRQWLVLNKLTPLGSDLLLSANFLPEIISVALLMGTIYSSVLPIASRIEVADRDSSKVSSYLNLINLTLFSLIGVLCLVGALFTPWILKLPLVTSEDIWKLVLENNLEADYILASRILFLFPLAFVVQAIWGVFLTLKKRFLVYSLAGVITNIGTILGLIFSEGDFVKVAIGMVWGTWISSLFFLFACFYDGYQWPKFSFSWIRKEFKVFKADFYLTWKLFLPRILVIDGFYAASFLIKPIAEAEGQITAFDIGSSIQGAFFILATSLGTVIFPDLSKLFHKSKENLTKFYRQTEKYIWLSVLVGILVSVVTFFGIPVVIYIFKYLGQDQSSYTLIIQVAQITSLSLVFRSLREILVRYIYIRERPWEPLILSVFSLLGTFAVTFYLYYRGVDSAIAASWGFVTYNIVWTVVAFFIFEKDKLDILRKSPLHKLAD